MMEGLVPEEFCDWDKAIKNRVKSLQAIDDKYCAMSCDRMGELNLLLIAISRAKWKLHSVHSFVLPPDITAYPRTFFCVIAENNLESK